MGGSMVERYQKLGLKESLNQAYHYYCVLKWKKEGRVRESESVPSSKVITRYCLILQLQFRVLSQLVKIGVSSSSSLRVGVTTVENSKFLVAANLQDVLVHIFGFLDLKSLVTASLVCRPWSVAASDNHLWQSIHISFSGSQSDNPNIIRLTYDLFICVAVLTQEFQEKVTSEGLLQAVQFNCLQLSNSKCCNECYGKITDRHQIIPVSLEQIVEYVIDESIPSLDSDSDSDDSVDSSFFKLWAYPRRFENMQLISLLCYYVIFGASGLLGELYMRWSKGNIPNNFRALFISILSAAATPGQCPQAEPSDLGWDLVH
ncbi:hypothetical protein HAX54_008531 [Datura stramonium]|uniref:F-box domain-containing protein n=1 Tax=Datura stramonium TaxID=4076 RepID=A0ABS8TET3_DATST|nr:hypothetical protein [Datura stramonium]